LKIVWINVLKKLLNQGRHNFMDAVFTYLQGFLPMSASNCPRQGWGAFSPNLLFVDINHLAE